MNNARKNILTRIENANSHIDSAESARIVSERLKRHPRGPIPENPDAMLTGFIKKLQQAAASYKFIESVNEIVPAVNEYLAEHKLKGTLIRNSSPSLDRIEWPDTLQVEVRDATAGDVVVLVEASLAVAETGSIVMFSGNTTPVNANFLPDHYLCLVHEHGVVSSMEDVWDHLRHNDTAMPRAINFITGPSRTADVEQIIQMGAHGPRRVHVLLLRS